MFTYCRFFHVESLKNDLIQSYLIFDYLDVPSVHLIFIFNFNQQLCNYYYVRLLYVTVLIM